MSKVPSFISIKIFVCLFFFLGWLEASWEESETFPVLYQGRFRSARAYSHSWLYDFYHSSSIKKEDLPLFGEPLSLLWSLEFHPSRELKEAPLFFVESKAVKEKLQLPPHRHRFSFSTLTPLRSYQPNEHPFLQEKINQKLLFQLKEWESLFTPSSLEEKFQARFLELKRQNSSREAIARILEEEFPLALRLKTMGSLFKALPLKQQPHVWLPLKTLTLKTYDIHEDHLAYLANFTAFSDEHFQEIQSTYLQLKSAYLSHSTEKIQELTKHLSLTLLAAYAPLAGTPLLLTEYKEISAPWRSQLQVETLYFSYPWISIIFLLYTLSVAFFFCERALFSKKEDKRTGRNSLLTLAWIAFSSAFFLHTTLLLARSFILERPPVANMLETLIYAPWVIALAALSVPFLRHQTLVPMACALVCSSLLGILQISHLNPHFEQLQAVLDSQFWLFVHVLLVVASYGFFLLASLLAFFDLVFFLRARPSPASLSSIILKTLYAGTLMLIGGTLLGAAWAAESWGRFWDWDPKEAWAFISCSFYLTWIHAYRFHYIGPFGLSMAALGGLGAISFTWYGVNYILGTGLHSYGFGQGGQWPYFLFLASLFLFLALCLLKKRGRV